MTAALRYEWRRLTTILSTWIMASLAVLVILGFSALFAIVTSSSIPEPGVLTPGALGQLVVNPFFINLGGVFLSVIAAQAIGQDYRHGMIRLTLSAFPRRSVILSAKVLLMLLTVAVVSVVAFALSSLVGILTAHVGVDTVSLVMMGKGIIVLLLYCTITFALTVLTRILALGIIIPVVVALILEGILTAIAFFSNNEWLARILPFQQAFADLSPDTGWSGIGILAAWTVGLMAIAWVVFQRRDA